MTARRRASETAFFVPQAGEFHIRWFTPAIEVNLCGHAVEHLSGVIELSPVARG